jgi:hypothetical protein
METRSLLAAVAATAFCLAPAFARAPAEEKAAPEMPKPAAEMAQLKFFDGSWTCEGIMQPSPFGPGGKMTSTVKSQTDFGGFWQSGTVKGSSPGMPPFEGMFHMTYDPGTKQHVSLWVDNMGAWSHSTSRGWEGDKIVFEGESAMGGKKIMGRDAFIKNADGSMRHTWEMQLDGKWTSIGDETCRKGVKGK